MAHLEVKHNKIPCGIKQLRSLLQHSGLEHLKHPGSLHPNLISSCGISLVGPLFHFYSKP